MVARGTFDDSIRAELRGRGNVNRGDAQQEARDRAARKQNAAEGRGTRSTAYKPSEPRAAKAKGGDGSGGGRRKSAPSKGVPTPRGRPSTLPNEGPIPTPNPVGGLPVAQGGNPLELLIPMLLSQIASRGQKFTAPNGPLANEVATGPISTQIPREQPLGAAPENAIPMPNTDDPIGRFLTESEIGGMQTRMPGVIDTPGWGSRAPIPEFDPNIHVPPVKGVRP